MGLQQFERRLERLVEGTFARAFRSGLQPVEVARRLVRAMEAGRTLGVQGRVVPNEYLVALSHEDADRFEPFADSLMRELEGAAREHARQEEYRFLGPVKVQLARDPKLRQGALDIESSIVESEGPRAALVLPDGVRFPLTETGAQIGRLPDCTVRLTDAQASRHHAEVSVHQGGFRIVDLGSTNGTLVNGTRITEQVLHDGDEIRVGATTLRFEVS